MECEEARPQLIRYADNDLLPGARMAVREHLAHCYYCHEELQELEGLLDRCHTLLQHPDPRNRFDDLRPHLRPPVAPANVTRFRVRQTLVKLGSAAAAAMFLVMLTWLTAPAVQAAYDFSLMAEAYRAQRNQEITASEPGSDSTPMAWRRSLWERALAEREKAEEPEADKAPPQQGAEPGPETPMSWRGADPTDEQRAEAAGEPRGERRAA